MDLQSFLHQYEADYPDRVWHIRADVPRDHLRGHLWDYQRRAEARGQDLELAVVIGMQPAFLIGAASRVGIDVDEYLDPSSENGLSSKLAIDATRPLDWEPQRCTIPTEIAHEARELINSHLRDIA